MTKKNITIYILSFILPVFAVIINLFIFKKFPFGDESFIYWDSEFQYINYFEYLKTIFTSNNNIFYSFSQLGGNNMLDFAGYYNFFSPLNIIFFLFPDKYLNIALELLMIIKFGLCGLACSYFLNNEVKKSCLSVFLSLSYALSMHSLITTMSNFILMDGIILLPLVLSGISNIVEHKNYKLYLVAMFLSLLTNAYAGYVNLLFSSVYFIYKAVLKDKNTILEHLKNIKTYLFATTIALGLNAWLFLPVKYALENGKYSYFDIPGRFFVIRADFISIFSKFFTGNLEKMYFCDNNYPYLFTGLLIVVLFILYFFNSAYSKKERIVSFIFSLFLYACLSVNVLFTLFNMGVEYPNGTIYRYTIVQILFIVLLAYKSITNLSSIKPRFVILSGLILSDLCWFVNQKMDLIHDFNFQIDILLFSVILVFVLIVSTFRKKILSICFISLLCLINVFNIIYNMEEVFKSQKMCLSSPNINSFITYVKAGKNAVKYLNNIDDGFYRTETQLNFIDFYENAFYNNSPQLLNFNGITYYGSFGKPKVKEFYGNIGYLILYDNNIGITYKDTMPVFPLFLSGVKYIITKNELQHPYKYITTLNDIEDMPLNIYQNPYSLPVAFIIDKNKEIQNNLKFTNVQDYQNSIAKILSNEDYGNIYNCIFKENFHWFLKNAFVEQNTFEFSYITDNFQKLQNIYLGIYYNVEFKDSLVFNIWYNDNFIKNYCTDSKFETVFLDNRKFNNQLNIKFNISGMNEIHKYDLEKYYIGLVTENLDILKKYYDKLSQNPCNLKKISSSHLKGTLKVQDNDKMLYLSIPYDESWQIKINGRKRKAVKVFDAMTAVPLFKDDAEIEMIYIPKGFYPGLIISLLSLLVLSANLFLKRKRQN